MSTFLKVAFALFIALDAVGTLPFYLALTHQLEPRERRRVVWEGMLVAFLISCSFAVVGQVFFQTMNLKLGDFMIAGGIFLLLVSILTFMEILQTQEMKSQNLSIVPFGTPLLAGPALLSTTVLFTTLYGYSITLGALAIVCLVSAIILLLGDFFLRLLGEGVLKGISKVTSLFLASIAVMLIRQGIEDIIRTFPGR